jgi:hydroxymethylglutaryl-CoA lyase
LHLHQSAAPAPSLLRPALDRGVRSFDSSAGGLGGCPYASTPRRRAPGNISTAALVAAIQELGHSCRVDSRKLAEASAFAQSLIAASPIDMHK